MDSSYVSLSEWQRGDIDELNDELYEPGEEQQSPPQQQQHGISAAERERIVAQQAEMLARAAAQPSSVPGGPPISSSAIPGHASPALAASPSPAAVVDADGSLCIICLQTYTNEDEIWGCDTCFLPVHLRCMKDWCCENEQRNRFARCPSCQTDVGCTSYELVYRCWCRRNVWANSRGVEGVVPQHSCGETCNRTRAHGCEHRCGDKCHSGKCPPCGHQKIGVPCVGGHQVFEPFPCGTETPKCLEICNAIMECDHPCQRICHSGPHQACQAPVAKSCACGKAVDSVVVPCSQLIVQCESICEKLRSCQQHKCERKCHVGNCAETMIVSAWNKNAWIKVGAPPVINTDRPAPIGFPALSSAGVASSPAPQPQRQSAPHAGCGKTCGKRRHCGHHCTQLCHALDPPQEEAAVALMSLQRSCMARQESKDNEEQKASEHQSSLPSSTCESVRCAQLIDAACPCGRKSAKLRCFESSSPDHQLRFQCDQRCQISVAGQALFNDLSQADAATKNHMLTFIPFSQSMLTFLSHSDSNHKQFITRTEQLIYKFCTDLAAHSDHQASQAAASTLNLNSLTSSSYHAHHPTPTPVTFHNLPSTRRQLVQQLAVWSNLSFGVETEMLERDPGATLILPQMTASAAATAYKAAELSPTICIADSWPPALTIPLRFTDSLFDDESHHLSLIRSCIQPFITYCRICIINAHLVHLIFGSAVRARQCYQQLNQKYGDQLTQQYIQLEAPAPVNAAQAELNKEALESEILKQQLLENRRQTSEEFDQLRSKTAQHRANNPSPSSSILTKAYQKRTVSTLPSNLQGHTKLKVKSNNLFDLLSE